MNRVKTTTTTTGTGNITVSATAAARCRPLSSLATGRQVVIMIEDEAGTDWELVACTVLTATTFSRDTVLDGSAGPGVKVNFAAGTKTVFVTTDANAIALVSDVPFSAVIPLSRPGSAYMADKTVTGPLTFTAAAGAVRGALVYLRMIADGVNLPNFSAFKEWGGSSGYDNRNGIVNQVQFFYDGADLFYTASQAVGAVPVPAAATGVTMTGPTGGVNGVASSNFTLGVTPVGGTISGTVRITPASTVPGDTFTPAFRDVTTASQTGTFTLTPSSTGPRTISATNNGGLTPPATITYTATAAATVPAAPTIGTAVAGDGYIDVAFTRNSDGGSAVLDSTATLSTGQTATGTTSPIRVTAPNGTPATATVKDRNTVGLSAASAASNSVTPAAATSGLRFGSLVRVSESGTDPYTYTGSGAAAGFGTTEGDSVLNKAFQAGVDGEFVFKVLNTPTGSSNELLIGVDASASTPQQYTTIDYSVVGHASGYQPFTSGSAGSSVSAAAANDFVKVSRVGTALTVKVSKDGGATYPTTAGSWTVATGVLYIHMLVTGAGSWTPINSSGLA